MYYDRIIIGAGLYGLYSALHCGEKGQSILVLDCDSGPFRRATYINQARVHMGYHYPRSLATAMKSAHYFNRFCEEYGFCIHTQFDQIYATSSKFSWTSAAEFKKFCQAAGIRCEETNPERYFKPAICDGAFVTTEYTYDAAILREWFVKKLTALPNVKLVYQKRIESVQKKNFCWEISVGRNIVETPFLLNATYAGINEIHRLFGFSPVKIKYELCEIILCQTNEKLRNVGLTVMDGPFFSIMPFGKTGYHSLTSVAFTPHHTSYDTDARFSCQALSEGKCAPGRLFNCNDCPGRPETAWPYMCQLVRKYLTEEQTFSYVKSLFSMKPILLASEIDDSRPTMIYQYCDKPTFVSVLSGKINTVFDLDEVLDHE